MMLVIGVLNTSAHSLTNEVGIGSRAHVLVLKDERIFSTSSADSGLKEYRVFLKELHLVTGMGDDDWKPVLILKIFSLKKHANIFARSARFLWSDNITSEDLCRIFWKLFHNDFGFPSFSATILEYVSWPVQGENCPG